MVDFEVGYIEGDLIPGFEIRSLELRCQNPYGTLHTRYFVPNNSSGEGWSFSRSNAPESLANGEIVVLNHHFSPLPIRDARDGSTWNSSAIEAPELCIGYDGIVWIEYEFYSSYILPDAVGELGEIKVIPPSAATFLLGETGIRIGVCDGVNGWFF